MINYKEKILKLYKIKINMDLLIHILLNYHAENNLNKENYKLLNFILNNKVLLNYHLKIHNIKLN